MDLCQWVPRRTVSADEIARRCAAIGRAEAVPKSVDAQKKKKKKKKKIQSHESWLYLDVI